MTDKVENKVPAEEAATAPATPPVPRRGPGHRGADVRDTVAEMAARAQEISQEAGSKMAAAMKDVINAAAGLTGFAIESGRDLVQYMVRRGQMTQEEADRLMREAEEAQPRGKQTNARPAATGTPMASGSFAHAGDGKTQAARPAVSPPRAATKQAPATPMAPTARPTAPSPALKAVKSPATVGKKPASNTRKPTTPSKPAKVSKPAPKASKPAPSKSAAKKPAKKPSAKPPAKSATKRR